LDLPYFYGCVVVTGIILVYTLRGGLRAVAWTDLFQGSLMFILLVAALIMVALHHGGFVEANQKVSDSISSESIPWPPFFRFFAVKVP
jgi:SSS family solute:Na+ symporter